MNSIVSEVLLAVRKRIGIVWNWKIAIQLFNQDVVFVYVFMYKMKN